MRDSLAFLLQPAVEDSSVSLRQRSGFLEALPRGGAGCIVTDVRMPEHERHGAAAAAAATCRSLLPVIVITGHGDVPLAVEAMKGGASDFIEKPFDDEALLTSVRAALDKHRGAIERNEAKAEIHDRPAKLSAIRN